MYNRRVWRKFHLLGRVQVFVLSSLSAAIVAVPFAITSISHDETAFMRDLFWPHQFTPAIAFNSVFLSIIPVLLAYYHLGRLGAMLSLAVSVMAFYAGPLCAILVFRPHAESVGAVGYLGASLLLYVLLFVVHLRAATSSMIQSAQRALHLLDYGRIT